MAKETVPDLMGQALSDAEVKEYSARQHLSERRKRHRGWAVQGPFPWDQWCLVSKLPGKALAVWMLIHHRAKMKREIWVSLPLELLIEVGISQDAKDRAFRQLERHGLVLVKRHPGQSTRIALVSTDPDTAER
jgi:hypothetical protein